MSYLKKRIQSFGYAFKGIGTFFKDEAHPKIHLLAALVITALGFYLNLSATEWCLIVICMALVLCAEAMNSALENLTDLASPDPHPLAGKAKDIAAGAVLMTVILGGIVWSIIFIPKLLALWA
ncbi:MAG: diacylglycerol kinase family protein [Bacteroidota bacterium]